MADGTELQRFVPYESASELRDANSVLLDAYDHALEKDSSAEGDTRHCERSSVTSTSF